MKIVMSDTKTGKTYQAEIPTDKEGSVVGMKVGDVIEGGLVGAAGYKLQITGGSDKDGIPIRPDVSGSRRKRSILSGGPGIRVTEKGERRRKTVRGNVITAEIMQLNTKVTEQGEKKLEELFPPKPKAEKKQE